MNLYDLFSSSSLTWAGLGFVLLFFILILIYTVVTRRHPGKVLRDIPAFRNLRRAVGLSVEAGKNFPFSFGWGDMNGLQAASAFLGVSGFPSIPRAASVRARPPVAPPQRRAQRWPGRGRRFLAAERLGRRRLRRRRQPEPHAGRPLQPAQHRPARGQVRRRSLLTTPASRDGQLRAGAVSSRPVPRRARSCRRYRPVHGQPPGSG